MDRTRRILEWTSNGARVWFLVAVLPCVGCYTTRIDVRPALGVRASSEDLEHRQWFTVGGLVGLSGPAGDDCPHGVAVAESETGTVDVLVSIGLTVAGAAVGAALCKSEDPAARASCVSLATTTAPLLLASRTVRYRCAAKAGAK